MIEQKPSDPEVLDNRNLRVFLAGSIENGQADDWQRRLIGMFKADDPITFFNPRRDDWDSSWETTNTPGPFRTQVNWELDHIRLADLVVFYFDPNTISPITLLELGICVGLYRDRTVVCCPQGYFRKGNVDIVCHRYRIPQVSSIEDLHKYVEKFEGGV